MNKIVIKVRPLLASTLAFLLCFSLTACSGQRHTASWTDLFDTYSSLTIYDPMTSLRSDRLSDQLHDYLLTFHQETDIYHHYEGMVNLYDLNQAAGKEALPVSDQLFDFLYWCRTACQESQGKVNVMLGPVTALWEQTRKDGKLPSDRALQEAGTHVSIDLLVLDQKVKTAYISDPDGRIDVGALAKGYAGKLAGRWLSDQCLDDYLIDLGGNIITKGKPKGSGHNSFVIGIRDPDRTDGSYSQTVTLSGSTSCAVTSGDYERYIDINGRRYHHIIDPDTLYPSTWHHSVTILCSDSAAADMLSTALFCMNEKDGRKLAASYQAEVIYQDQ